MQMQVQSETQHDEDFLSRLASSHRVGPQDLTVLQASGVHSAETLRDFLESFPTTAAQYLSDIPLLSSVAVTELVPFGQAPSAASSAFTRSMVAGEPLLEFPIHGAAVPEGAPFQVGDVLSLDDAIAHLPPPAALGTSLPPLAGLPAVQGQAWPVKAQQDRETCVSFSVVALMEHANGHSISLSEQFLHWAIKTGGQDPDTRTEPTLIRYGVLAAGNHGSCETTLCPYNPVAINGNPGQDQTPHAPSPLAIDDASGRRMPGGVHAFTHTTSFGKAARVIQALAQRGAVAVSLPVFGEPNAPTNNWTSRTAQLFGSIMNPPPGTTVQGAHAVCITGFVPDAHEPTGGYFIVRNSWGPAWGRDLPVPGYLGPGQGYGQISATYVDKHLYEIAHF